ncbi:hypothetical protein [Archangium lansingense]|uniref:DoxX family protein n=1 Tax=Archangium lansingense TaxID=2995310 RepID=A0ABT3ZZ91_9BACT|nr:hypothetical protein [Archangium lansinium]MCY1074693.1 hypothetical protein [Archangium lansinium]
MSLEASLDSLHARVVASQWLRRFTAFTRGLLAVGFLRPGLIKVFGLPFTSSPGDDAVGRFFDAMQQTGGYWRFIGVAQVTAALLLLMPRSGPTVGALVFLPVILNIFVITVAVGFQGTWLITGLMLLAVLYLVCWDYPRWKSIVFEPSPERSIPPTREPVPWVLTLTTALVIQSGFGAMTGFGKASAMVLTSFILGFGVPLLLLILRRLRPGLG